MILPAALLLEGPPPTLGLSNLAGYGYLSAVNTGLAYWVWFRGIERLPANSIAFLALLSPVTAAAIGWVVLGQGLAPLQVLGMAVAIVGSLLGATSASLRRTSRPLPADPPFDPLPTGPVRPATAC
jgi:probable blue pigment (indigoidine) exporter